MNPYKIVNGAILGFDGEPVEVNGVVYIIKPLTIAKIAGGMFFLSDLSDVQTFEDVFKSLKDIGKVSKALSWFIQGNESLSEELSKGSFDEIVKAIEVALSTVSAENFTRLLILVRNVARLTANPRP